MICTGVSRGAITSPIYLVTKVTPRRELESFSSPVIRVFRDVGEDGGVGVDEEEGPADESWTSLRTRGPPRLIRLGGVGVVGLLLLSASVTRCLNSGEISPWKKGEEGPVLTVDGWCGIMSGSTCLSRARAKMDSYRGCLRRPKRDSCRWVPTKNLVKRLETSPNLRRVPLSVSRRKRNIRPFVGFVPEPFESHWPSGRWRYAYERRGQKWCEKMKGWEIGR